MENRFNDSTKRAKLTRRLISALALSLGLSLFMPSAAPVFGQQAPEAQMPERTSEVADQTQAPSTSKLSRTFVEAARRIKPAVAHIKLGNGASITLAERPGRRAAYNHLGPVLYNRLRPQRRTH